ncbi:hypothetical protein ACE01N_20375 [Saccharicrinis sp. FJH2]|uniref:hypothetical protein n=1 Tax=Saccharicrinis sp. FJH65 TaxID=3344659 RepID=UPI0035F4F8A4
MKRNILHIIIFLLISPVGFAQVEITTQEGTYKMGKASSDFILGKIMYESYKYTEPEKYRKDRIKAIEMITESAESGYAPAQYYLGTIYLNDTLIHDYNKAIGFLKKSAYQRNNDAIKLLDSLGEDYEVAINYQFWIKIFVISLLVLIYFLLSLIAHRKIGKSKLITQNHKKRLKKLTWLMPYFGSLIGLFNNKKVIQPLDNESIEWINRSFDWIIKEFGKETVLNSEIIIPVKSKIPIKFNATEDCAKELIDFVASKMQINRDLIDVGFYNQSQMELGGNFITQQYEKDKYSSGQYWGKSKKGKYQISLEKSQLNNPLALIATVAHELAHIKLLGEKRIKENDEYLTDLIPIIFGFGIFNANSIFQYQQNSYGWRANSQGYLNERMYGFALAKFALYRCDYESDWSKYLTPTVKEEFEKSMLYIKENE